jgi:hypothetical protein
VITAKLLQISHKYIAQNSNIGRAKNATIMGKAELWEAPKLPHNYGIIGKGLTPGCIEFFLEPFFATTRNKKFFLKNGIAP